jgi:hypothetical protein
MNSSQIQYSPSTLTAMGYQANQRCHSDRVVAWRKRCARAPTIRRACRRVGHFIALSPELAPDRNFKGANRERCVNYFTLRSTITTTLQPRHRRKPRLFENSWPRAGPAAFARPVFPTPAGTGVGVAASSRSREFLTIAGAGAHRVGRPAQFVSGDLERFRSALEMSDDELATIATGGGDGVDSPPQRPKKSR